MKKYPAQTNLASVTGFTLIELLIVIAVLGSIAAFTLLRLVGPERSARDRRRMSDIKQYQNAIEVYSNRNNGLYPIRSSTVNARTLCGASAPLGAITCADDPQTPGSYSYQSDTAGTRYVLWAPMEKTNDMFGVCSNGVAGIKPRTGSGAWVNPTNGNCPL